VDAETGRDTRRLLLESEALVKYSHSLREESQKLRRLAREERENLAGHLRGAASPSAGERGRAGINTRG
jgi:hypothetical protein